MTQTDRIKEDLRRRLRNGEPLPARLTLPELARHYGVSVTPVRRAVEELATAGILEKDSNGRLRFVPLPEGGVTPSAARAKNHAAEGFEDALVREVIGRSLRGDDSYLREEAMAARFGVGRTILRQAFARLSGKGLLIHVPRRGWRVRTFDEADMTAYLVVRESLELTALELALPHLDPLQLIAMRDGNSPGVNGALARLDNRLHHYLLEKAGNRYLCDFFEQYGLYYTFLFDYAAPEAHVMDEMARQHHLILTALLDGNVARAREVLVLHIRAQRPIIRRLLERLTQTIPE